MNYLIQDKNKHTIAFDNIGFTITKPVSEMVCIIKWSIIDTILLALNTTDRDCAEWIIFFNEPPQWKLNSDAWWLNKFSFFMKDKKYKKLRIRDDVNKDFYELPAIVEKYLLENLKIDSNKNIEINNRNINKEFWNPKRTNGLPAKMLYDRYNRAVDDIYKRDGAI
ncbi:hypothetical protein [Flavobacterium sp.]|uniref:hypothetical protein n=1 Tax=Flavobacterium sp. TaxID=239 RepID=UPI00286DD690|nr:hypothetical protein [Flavobacterium sp.]